MKNLRNTAVLAAAFLLTPSLATAHGGHEGTVVVESVNAGSPAAAAGLQTGDKLLRFDDLKIASETDLRKALAAYEPGDKTLLTVVREGETLVLPLVFGTGPSGGVSVGVTLAVTASPEPGQKATDGEQLSRSECLRYVDDTYRVSSLVEDLELDLVSEAQALSTCIEANVQQMPASMPVRYCENAFKVHCSAVDLLAEIGEAQVERCEDWLGERLDSCASQKVFDRYSLQGLESDHRSCQSAISSCAETQ